MEQIVKKQRITLTEAMRARFKGLLDPVAAFLNKIGVYPNTITLLGLAGNTIGAYFLARGQMTAGGLWILAMGPVDALDGSMARLRGEATNWGAFVDSVTDRYSELVIFGSLLLHYELQGDLWGVIATYLAAAGAVLVSYVRARSASLGYDIKVGAFTRMERFFVLVAALIFNLPFYGLAILAIGTHFTALQRIWAMRKHAR